MFLATTPALLEARSYFRDFDQMARLLREKSHLEKFRAGIVVLSSHQPAVPYADLEGQFLRAEPA